MIPEDPAIRVGWSHIRGMGEKARERLRAARARRTRSTSIEDVIRRAELGRAEALHLARAGALEAFEPGRYAAAWEALRAAGDLLPLAPARRLPFNPEELQGQERIFLDYLATGICAVGHPMEHLRTRLQRRRRRLEPGSGRTPEGGLHHRLRSRYRSTTPRDR